MGSRHLGIGAKLNLGLGLVLLSVAAAFGVGYAMLERGTVLDIERVHLRHMAALARLHFANVGDRRELEAMVSEFSRNLTYSRDAPHRLIVKDDRGRVLATSDPGGADTPAREASPTEDRSATFGMHPATLRAKLPLSVERYRVDADGGRPTQIVLYETLPRLAEMFRTSLKRHLAFASALAGLAMVASGFLVHRLVVGPVRGLVTATDQIAQHGHWEPIAPQGRGQDEIGILEDHLAQMSRRLVEAVRQERYGSAHLVAEGVRRELDEPLRRAAMELAVLEKLLPPDPDLARARAQIAAELEEITEISQRWQTVSTSPPR